MAYNKISLFGEQTCGYIYVQNGAPDETMFSYVDDEPAGWTEATSFYANFNNEEARLAAGNSAIVGNISGYEIYRKKYDEPNAEYIGTVKNVDINSNNFIIDYATKNGVDYIYYLFPNSALSESGTQLSPLVTSQLSLDTPCWSLMIVDDTDDENVFYLDKMFKFELNLQVADMTNNAQISISQNFTKYPTLQYGTSNYWSGSLSSLCGYMAANDVDYIQNEKMIDELKAISSDTRRKFLKDISGNLWEVNVSAPINISTESMTLQELKTCRFSWVEVGDTKGISIINNPSKHAVDWILTESGEAIPYIKYEWNESSVWDNSYYWTTTNNK